MNPSALARALGRRGGLARAKRLPSADRVRIATSGGHARRESLLAARRIAANFEYQAAINELRPMPAVERVAECRERLPDLTRNG